MNVLPLDRPKETSPYLQSWTLSLLLHVLAVGAAILLVADLKLAPQPQPFQWNVSMVEALQSGISSEAAVGAEAASLDAPPVAPQAELRPPVQSSPPRDRPRTMKPSPGTPQQTVSPASPSVAVNQATEAPPSVQEPPAIAPPPQNASESSRATPHAEIPRPQADQSESSAKTATPVPMPETQDVTPEPRTQPTTEYTSDNERSPSLPKTSGSAHAPSDPPQAETSASSLTSGKEGFPADLESSNQQIAAQLHAQSTSASKSDFGWLGEALRNRLQETNKYSAKARMNGVEGRVVLRVTIKEDGELLATISKSSGHDILDQDALEAVKRISPLPLKHPLGLPQQVLTLPMTYTLTKQAF